MSEKPTYSEPSYAKPGGQQTLPWYRENIDKYLLPRVREILEADITSEAESLQSLKTRVDVISISAVLHQWNWDDQIRCLQQVVAFSKVGTLIVGHQIGNVRGQLTKQGSWRQSPETFDEMCKIASDKTGTKWEVRTRLLSWEDMGWSASDMAFFEHGACVIDFDSVLGRVE